MDKSLMGPYQGLLVEILVYRFLNSAREICSNEKDKQFILSVANKINNEFLLIDQENT